MDSVQKNVEVSTLTEWFKTSQVAVCADYRGMTVAQLSNFRKQIRAAGGKTRVVKNTLARLGAKQALTGKTSKDLDLFVSSLKGPTLIVYSFSDPVAPTKIIAKTAKDVEAFTIKGAFLDGQFLDDSGVQTLSQMPGREEVLAQLLRLMNTPATSLVRLLAAPGTQVVRCIEAYREKLAGE
jgi:large subunit ribosomal protein L10